MSCVTTADEIVAAAEKLAPATRREVLRRIASTLEPGREISERRAETLWLKESEKRARELREGKVEEIPLDKALRDARSRLD